MKIKIKLSYLYYVTVLLILLNNWLTETKFLQSIYINLKDLVLIAIFVNVILQFCMMRYNLKTIILIIPTLSICIYTSYITKNTWLIYLFLVLVFCKNKNIKTTMKIISNCLICFFAINFIAFITMYIFNPDSVPVLYSANKVRWSINFLSPNNAARYLIFIVLAYCYSNYDLKNNKAWIIFSLTIGIVYMLTKSDALLLIPLIFLLIKCKNNNVVKFIVGKFSKFGFIAIWFLSYICIFFQNNPFVTWLDSLSTGRLKLGARGIEFYGTTFFGSNTLLGTYININDSYLYMGIDNAYLYFMVHTGIFYLLMISIIFWKANSKLDYKSRVCITIYIIYALFENNIIAATSFFPIIIAIDAIINNKSYSRCIINTSDIRDKEGV